MVKSLSFNVLYRFKLKTLIVKKYYSAVYAPKVADLYSQKRPLITLKPCFYGSKSMFFCLVIHPDKQTNVNHLAFSHHTINIRYLFVFQIEKIFCPKFLLKARTAD